MTVADESHPAAVAPDRLPLRPAVAADVADDTAVSPPTPHPPKPRLTLRVGISGHRPKPEKFPQSSFARVREQLGATFAAIDQALIALATSNVPFYDPGPHKVRLVSGLAEGADQMAVDARPPGWDLDAILPFPLERYRQDFERSAMDPTVNVAASFETVLGKATTVVQLPEIPVERRANPSEAAAQEANEAAYAQLGVFLIRQIDVLVAVWDGYGEDGPGGTGDVIRRAIEARIPVVWIATLDDRAPSLLDEVKPDGTPLSISGDCLSGPLAAAISTIVSVPPDPPPDTAAHRLPGPTVTKRLTAFLNETWPRPTRSITYDLLKRWTEGRPWRWLIATESWATMRKPWLSFIAGAPEAGDLGQRIASVLMPRYAWADALAVDLSHRYRAAYVNSYLLAASAVLLALSVVVVEDFIHLPGEILIIKAGVVFFECVVIFTILRIIRRGRRGRWQERWLEYRALAEMLRDARFLAYFGEHGFIQRADETEPAGSSWFLWYVRATIREVGLPHAALNRDYQETLIDAVASHVLDDQIKYNVDSARTLVHMHHALHKSATWCFYVTAGVMVVFCVGFVIFAVGYSLEGGSITRFMELMRENEPFVNRARELPPTLPQRIGAFLHHVKGIVTLCAAFLPALGAALAGIRETGDFEGFAERSLKTANALQDLKRQIPLIKRELTLEATDDFLVATAQVLTEDLSSWRSVYGRKQLTLPA